MLLSLLDSLPLCCGGNEKFKASNFVAHDWTRKKTTSLENSKKRIQRREEQISIMNRSQTKKLRGNICSKALEDSYVRKYTPPIYRKSDEEYDFIQSSLKDNFLFSDLNDEEIHMLTMAMNKETVTNGTVIIEKGHVGDFFYILQSGEVDYMDGTRWVGSCVPGGSFGELALLYNAPRAVSCVARTPAVTVWKVDQLTFRYIVAHNVHAQTKSIKEQLISSSEMFSKMSEYVADRFVSAMTRVQWKKGEMIVQKGDEGNVFYIITQGRVRVYDIGLGDSQAEDRILEPGECFGERSLILGEPRAANVVALTDVTTMAMDRDTFEEHLGPLKNSMEHTMRKNFLRAIPLFQNSDVTELELDQLVDRMVEVCYRAGDHLAESGKPDQMNLWIIEHGTLIVYSSTNPDAIYTLKSGDFFGDKSIRGDPNQVSTFTAVCEKNLTACVLSRAEIEAVIGDIERLGDTGSFVKSRVDNEIDFADLDKHRILGTGAFGTVWLVSHKETKTRYALKTISKRKLIESQQVQSVIREKELLNTLQNQFIVQLVASYQDENELFLLLPVIPGGELFARVQQCRTRTRALRNHDAAFYAACIIEAIGHFHHLSIAYRDLKLENVLIGEDGYCVLVDLGFAKIVTDKTFTLVGTPEYIAPEIIMSKGYDKAADYWSYGVLLYELLVGVSPFFKSRSTQMEMFKRIVMVDYAFPENMNEDAKALISKLLIRRPSQRLGNLANGYIDIKKAKWFAENDIDFKELIRKQIPAPWKPELSESLKLKDTFGSFSSWPEKEDVSQPLTVKEQELFSNF